MGINCLKLCENENLFVNSQRLSMRRFDSKKVVEILKGKTGDKIIESVIVIQRAYKQHLLMVNKTKDFSRMKEHFITRPVSEKKLSLVGDNNKSTKEIKKNLIEGKSTKQNPGLIQNVAGNNASSLKKKVHKFDSIGEIYNKYDQNLVYESAKGKGKSVENFCKPVVQMKNKKDNGDEPGVILEGGADSSSKSSDVFSSDIDSMKEEECGEYMNCDMEMHAFSLLSEDDAGHARFGYNGNFTQKKMKFTYKGYMHKTSGKKEGFGIATWKDTSVGFGVFVENKVCGMCRFVDIGNQSEFNGFYVQNSPNGYGIFKQNNVITEGKWTKNKVNGLVIEFNFDGDSDYYYQGEMINNMKHGMGLYRWKDGTGYQGEWKNNEMYGMGFLAYHSTFYWGEVKHGKKDGYGEFCWSPEKGYIGFYKEDQKHGFGIYYGSIKPLNAYIGFWRKGIQHGVAVTIKENLIRYNGYKDGKVKATYKYAWEMRKECKKYELSFIKTIEKNPYAFFDYIYTNAYDSN